MQVTRRQHIQHAALVWVLVGMMIAGRGLYWLWSDPRTHAYFPYILLVAVALGVAKGLAVLSKSANGTVARIQQLAERTPFWQMYSPATYLLVAGMMAIGIACRWAGAHWHVTSEVGALYLIIGIALISGSRTYWAAQNVG